MTDRRWRTDMGKRHEFYQTIAQRLSDMVKDAPTEADRFLVLSWYYRARVLASTADDTALPPKLAYEPTNPPPKSSRKKVRDAE